MNNQYQQPLPFDPVNLMANPVTYQLNNPPYIPQGIQTLPQFNPLVPLACSLVANEVANTARSHAGRTFLFNKLSANGFANAGFGQVIATVFDLLLLGMHRGQYRNAEEGLQDAVRKAVGLSSASNFQQFPQLQQYVTPDIFADAVTNVNLLHSINAEVLAIKQSFQQQSMNTMPMQYPQNQMTMQRPQYPQNQNFGGQQYPQNFQQPVGMQPMSNPGVFVNQNTRQQQVVNNMQPLAQTSGKYDYLRNQQTNVAPIQPVQNEPQQVIVLPVQPPAAELKWRVSPFQFHPITVNPFTHKIGLKEVYDDKGNSFVITYPIQLTEEEKMDYNSHNIGLVTKALTSEIPNGYGSRMEAFSDTVDQLALRSKTRAVDGTEGAETTEDILKVTEDTVGIKANFLDNAIFNGQVQINLKEEEEVGSIHRVLAIIATPVVVKKDQFDFLERLLACETYQRLVTLLSNGMKDPDTLKLCVAIDNKFTKEVNSIINNRLSVEDVIGSFVEDAVPLIDYLSENYGENVSKAYLSCQNSFATTYLETLIVDEVVRTQLYENLICVTEYEENNLPIINFITQYYSLMYLEMNSKELEISMYNNIASSIIQSENPLLYKIAKYLFAKNENSSIDFAHRLLITNDNVVFEIHRGLLNSDFFTISKYK